MGTRRSLCPCSVERNVTLERYGKREGVVLDTSGRYQVFGFRAAQFMKMIACYGVVSKHRKPYVRAVALLSIKGMASALTGHIQSAKKFLQSLACLETVENEQ